MCVYILCVVLGGGFDCTWLCVYVFITYAWERVVVSRACSSCQPPHTRMTRLTSPPRPNTHIHLTQLRPHGAGRALQDQERAGPHAHLPEVHSFFNFIDHGNRSVCVCIIMDMSSILFIMESLSVYICIHNSGSTTHIYTQKQPNTQQTEPGRAVRGSAARAP